MEKQPAKQLFHERDGLNWLFPLEMKYYGREIKSEDFRKKVSGFWEKGAPFVGFAEYT